MKMKMKMNITNKYHIKHSNGDDGHYNVKRNAESTNKTSKENNKIQKMFKQTSATLLYLQIEYRTKISNNDVCVLFTVLQSEY